MKQAIAVLPYGMRLGKKLPNTDLDVLEWPLGRPDRLLAGTVADLHASDHLIVFPKTSMHFLGNWGTRAKISLMVAEPRDIHGRHLQILRLTGKRFYRIFTHDAKTLQRLKNARFMAAASTWVPEYEDLQIEKSRNISLIASNQNQLEGHKLRHALIAKIRDSNIGVDIMGRGYHPFDKKADGLSPYRFSVITENVRNKSYFTEKIVDALLCETVPIYWGAPNIERFFDPRAMIVCETVDQILTAINQADDALYQKMRPALLRAKAQAVDLRDYKRSAALDIQRNI
jgi:hypothetical protein